MNQVKGGNDLLWFCRCSCYYSGQPGGSSTNSNGMANTQIPGGSSINGNNEHVFSAHKKLK